jgi:uncharacterized SAM-binding protein YcdF (DUF218 family)
MMLDGGTPITEAVLVAAKALWDFHCIYDALGPADAIVGLGSYDIRVADRCAAIFAEGYAPRLIFTGSLGNWTRGLYEKSEAAIFADRAMSLGVPIGAIALEEQATNIGENLCFSARLLTGVGRVILVTKPQTQRRCWATAARQWPDMTAMVTAPVHEFEAQPTPTFAMEHLIHEMVGDLARMEIYAKAGFQARQDVPESVMRAYQFLVGQGYTEHVPTAAR